MALNRGEWVVARKITGVWTDIGAIYRPNANVSLSLMSTQARTSLADGSYAYVTPETRANAQPLAFTWYYVEYATKVQLETYMNGLYDLRITDHNANVYYGRFTNVTSVWLTGEEDPERYDITANFEVMPSLA